MRVKRLKCHMAYLHRNHFVFTKLISIVYIYSELIQRYVKKKTVLLSLNLDDTDYSWTMINIYRYTLFISKLNLSI